MAKKKNSENPDNIPERTPADDNFSIPEGIEKKCSFCGKPADNARFLIAGPPPAYPFICEECIIVIINLFIKETNGEWTKELYKILLDYHSANPVSRLQTEGKPNG